ncbi:hypothetical protein SLS58_004659 [Diplodia intermedia]|uniref:Uncharacterized protein n=1 Tax=Diplodia intermedia TaxID=856260 RepID=A0ABR3TTH4_9PEZI
MSERRTRYLKNIKALWHAFLVHNNIDTHRKGLSDITPDPERISVQHFKSWSEKVFTPNGTNYTDTCSMSRSFGQHKRSLGHDDIALNAMESNLERLIGYRPQIQRELSQEAPTLRERGMRNAEMPQYGWDSEEVRRLKEFRIPREDVIRSNDGVKPLAIPANTNTIPTKNIALGQRLEKCDDRLTAKVQSDCQECWTLLKAALIVLYGTSCGTNGSRLRIDAPPAPQALVENDIMLVLDKAHPEQRRADAFVNSEKRETGVTLAMWVYFIANDEAFTAEYQTIAGPLDDPTTTRGPTEYPLIIRTYDTKVKWDVEIARQIAGSKDGLIYDGVAFKAIPAFFTDYFEDGSNVGREEPLVPVGQEMRFPVWAVHNDQVVQLKATTRYVGGLYLIRNHEDDTLSGFAVLAVAGNLEKPDFLRLWFLCTDGDVQTDELSPQTLEDWFLAYSALPIMAIFKTNVSY